MKIGIFDSGFGGRFTLEKCKARLPNIEFIGFFDHANAPYGDKTHAEIINLTAIGVDNLFQQGCHIVLIACNTACTQALSRLQAQDRRRKILGCLVPATEIAVDSGTLSIGIIGTSRTVESLKYNREVFKINQKAKIHSLATPKLVPWIEAEQQASQECQAYLKQHIQTLIDNHHIDSLILGCTHYSAIKGHVEAIFPQLKIIDSAEAQAEKLVDYLNRHLELQQ